MAETRPTGRHHEIVEIAPSHCPNGHPLGPHQVIVGMGATPNGQRRTWTCRQCGALTWDDD